MKKVVIKKRFRYLIITILVTIFLFGIILLFHSLNLFKYNSSSIKYYNSITQDIDYRVYLNNNKFIDDEYLNKDEYYITDLVKNIIFTYNYNYTSSKISDLKYKININTSIIGNLNDNNNDKLLFNKIIDIKENSILETKNDLTYNDSINIDLSNYIPLIKDFKSQFKLSLIAYLNIEIEANIKGKIDDYDLNDVKTSIIKIPLDEKVFKIETSYIKSTPTSIYNNEIEEINYNELIIATILLISIIIIIIINYKSLFDIKERLKYQKILRQYGDIIVEINNPIDEKNKTVIILKSFNELLDLEEEMRIPILFYYNNVPIFIIMIENIIYKYILE